MDDDIAALRERLSDLEAQIEHHRANEEVAQYELAQAIVAMNAAHWTGLLDPVRRFLAALTPEAKQRFNIKI
jgi:hypothetical protein